MPYYILHKHKGVHHCACDYALSYYSCHCMPYYTHHKHKGAHHCVCVEVLSDCSIDWMPYYILHSNTDSLQYVCVDVLSCCSFYWMPYYKLHIKMDAHPSLYHRNICTLHSVHEVVHSGYSSKKKTFGYILIKTTIIFKAMYTFIKNPMHMKNCYLQKCIKWPIIFCFISSSNKTPAFSFMSHLL